MGDASRVGICARNTVEHLLALLATFAAGKVWVPLNPRNGRAELDAMIAGTKPSLIVSDASCIDRFTATGAPLVIGKTLPGAPNDRATVRGLIEQYTGRRPAPVERGDDDMQIIKFSGGSTGTPKPVVQSVRVLDAQARGLLEFFEFDASDVNLIAAPLTHGTSCFVLPLLAAGGRHVLIEDPKASIVADALSTHGITTLYAPPTLIYALLDEPSIASRSFPRLKHLIYSAAPMSADRIREAQRVFGPVVETAYGQVEAPQIVTAMRASEMLRREARVDRPSIIRRTDRDHERLRGTPAEWLGRRNRRAGPAGHARLSRSARGHGGNDQRRLASHRRPRLYRRARVCVHPRSASRGHQYGWVQGLSRGRRGCARSTPGSGGVLCVWRRGPEMGRGHSRSGGPRAWRGRRRQRAHRLSSKPSSIR